MWYKPYPVPNLVMADKIAQDISQLQISPVNFIITPTITPTITPPVIPEITPDILSQLEAPILDALQTRTLTKELLANMEYSDMLRLASINSYAAQVIQIYFNLRGLPLLPQYRLKPHQINCLKWMTSRESINQSGIIGGILRLEQGLGKTLTAIAYSLISPRGFYPTLVIASKTVMHEWKREGFEKFFGPNLQLNKDGSQECIMPINEGVKVLYLHSDFLKRSINYISRQTILQFDFVVTTYDVVLASYKSQEQFRNDVCEIGADHTIMVGKVVAVHPRTREQADLPYLSGKSVIHGTPWQRVICDESQRFANPRTNIYKAIMAVYGQYKWCLTGSPIRNYDTDIWAQMRFLGYTGITTATKWKKMGPSFFRIQGLDRCLLSMNYQQAGITLPARNTQNITFNLQGLELEIYKVLLSKAKVAFGLLLARLTDFASILALFIRLRQCCIAPYLMTSQSKRKKGRVKEDQRKADDVIEKLLAESNNTDLGAWAHDRDGTAGINSAKMTHTVNTLLSIPSNQKVLIFSSFTSVLDLLEYALEVKAPQYKLLMVDGDVVGEERAKRLQQFRIDPSIRALLLTYKVGSEGLNLTEAVHVMNIEPWWTPVVLEQAIHRAWRSGQTSEVAIYNIYIKNSIEDKMLSICEEKSRMTEAYLDGTGHKVRAGLDKYTMGRILGYYM